MRHQHYVMCPEYKEALLKGDRILAVVSSDWHAAPLTWMKRPDIKGDPQFAIEQIFSYANALGVPVIAAGDLIDVKQPSTATLSHLQRVLSCSDIPVFYTQGQHELSSPPWLSIFNLPHVKYMHRTSCQLQDIKLFGLDWQPKAAMIQSLDELELSDSDINVLMMHQTCSKFMGALVPCELEDYMLPDNLSAVLIGDYHDLKVDRIKSRGGINIPLISTGSTRATYFSTSSFNICLLRMSEKDRSIYVTSHPVESRIMVDSPVLKDMQEVELFVINMHEHLCNPAASVRTRSSMWVSESMFEDSVIQKPAIRLNYLWGASQSIDRETLRNYLELYSPPLHFILNVQPEDATQDTSDAIEMVYTSRSLLEGLDTLSSDALSKLVNSSEKPEVYDLISELIGTEGNIEEILRSRKTKYMETL